jgi:hypothetical protein
MAHPHFYNDNLFRAYPLIEPAADVPLSAIVDFGALLLAESGFRTSQHHVFLSRITKHDATIRFYFTSNAPGLLTSQLIFERDEDDPLFVTTFTIASPVSSSSSSSIINKDSSEAIIEEPCQADDFWQGYLVTGDMKALAQALDAHGGELVGPWPVEPSRIQNLSDTYVRSINIANAERTRATAPEGCRDCCYPFPRRSHYIVCQCLTGDIVISEGYNVSLAPDVSQNAIAVSGQIGAGLGQPCEELKLFHSEAPPHGRETLDGALQCHEVIRSINGVSRQFFTVLAGQGVQIRSLPEQHTLVISLDMHGLAYCPDFPEVGSLPAMSESSHPCDCGPK